MLAQVRDALGARAVAGRQSAGARSTSCATADRQLLHERHLVSKELAGLDQQHPLRSGAAVFLGRGGRAAGERGGSPAAAGAAVRVRGAAGVRGGAAAGPGAGRAGSVRVPPGVRLPDGLSDERGHRAARLGADPSAGAGADQGDRQGAGRPAADGADLPRAVRRGQRGGGQLLPALEPDDAGAIARRSCRTCWSGWCGM